VKGRLPPGVLSPSPPTQPTPHTRPAPEILTGVENVSTVIDISFNEGNGHHGTPRIR
jgi:hypothetical protein